MKVIPSLLCNSNVIIIVPTLACFFFLLYFISKLLLPQKNDAEGKRIAPKASGAWPIIGHLHLFACGKAPTHQILATMADMYGPIFGMRLGTQEVVVVSDFKTAEECFTTKDKELASRPKSLASEIMGYNYALVGIAPYGPYWREIKKMVTLELLSNRRLEMLRHIRESYARKSMRRTFAYWSNNQLEDGSVAVEMRQWFGRLILNLSIAMLFGEEDMPEESQLLKTILRFFDLFGKIVVADFIPWLRWADVGGHEKAMRRTAEEMDCAAERWLEDHKTRRNSKSKEERDFMDAMLSIFDDDTPSHQNHPVGFDNHVIIKSTCLNMLIAASDTTSVTLTWALSLILNHHDVVRRIQDELDTQVGRERCIEESDIDHLIYTQAVVKETMRLYPAAVLLLPHEAMEDCTIKGFHVSKGTRIVVNLAKIQRDPKIWVDPNEFRPERFLSTHKDVDLRGKSFELIPFGSGRRMCPGITLGLNIVHLTLASLLQCFDVKRSSEELIDLSETSGLTNPKATPLHALLVPRLASNLYA